MMIMYIPPSGKPALISVPRDSYVPIPGNGTNKINAAYSFGGPKLLVKTVEQNTGLRVDGYMEIGFGGFVNIIDALGGIDMCLPEGDQGQGQPPQPAEGLPDLERHERAGLRPDAQGRPAR